MRLLSSLRERMAGEPRTERARRRQEKKQKRRALDARIKAEYWDAQTRDIGGMGRIDPDRRR